LINLVNYIFKANLREMCS